MAQLKRLLLRIVHVYWIVLSNNSFVTFNVIVSFAIKRKHIRKNREKKKEIIDQLTNGSWHAMSCKGDYKRL